jgi:hypothetical protein
MEESEEEQPSEDKEEGGEGDGTGNTFYSVTQFAIFGNKLVCFRGE